MEIISIDQLIGRLKKYNHNELHVHHTWKPNHSNFNGKNHIQLQQNMKEYHMNTKRWSDIGQHITLMPDGTFVTGRYFGKSPASIAGHNKGGFCVEMLGNFDNGHDKLEGAQKASILRLAKFFYDKGNYIRFHRENASKTCPGTSIDKSAFMQEVKSFDLKKEEEKVDQVKIVANGKIYDGFIKDGVSYAPVRNIAESCGLEVKWDGKQVTLEKKVK